jgi:hypothetical protein
MQSIFNKHGIDHFNFIVLEEILDDRDLLEVEQNYLDNNFDNDNCINLSRNAMGGKINMNPWQAHLHNKGSKRSEETKRLQSESAKKLHKDNPHLMEAIREKAWAASAEYRKNKYPKFYLIKNEIHYGPFNTQKEVYTDKNKLMSNMAISELFQGKVKSVKGFSIKFINEDK